MWFLPTTGSSSLYNILVPKYSLSRLFNVDKIFIHFIHQEKIYKTALNENGHYLLTGVILNICYMPKVFFYAITIGTSKLHKECKSAKCAIHHKSLEAIKQQYSLSKYFA